MKKVIILSTIFSLFFVSIFSLSLYGQKNEAALPADKEQIKKKLQQERNKQIDGLRNNLNAYKNA